MRHVFFVAATLGLTSSLAFAVGSSVNEVEPNDSLITSQSLGSLSGALAILGQLETEDVDFYSFTLQADTLFSASVFDFTPDRLDDHDSVIALFDSGGTMLASDDDEGIGLLSSLSFHILQAGTYHMAISGFPDFDFVGDHGENFSYVLVIAASPIPAPAGFAILVGMGLMGRRCNR